jgi:hypothetical protein
MDQYNGADTVPLAEHRTVDFAVWGDVYSSCITEGYNGGRGASSPWNFPAASNQRVMTDGESTTVTAVNAGKEPFKFVEAGDSIWFLGRFPAEQTRGGRRVVASKTSDDEIEVDQAIDLSVVAADGKPGLDTNGYYFRWRTLTCESPTP